ncbi:PepSY domain-containing protein [Paracoccus aminophilus]|uniref:Uncharacterized protein n=1 Tax=Paracoccus aminophilus JCM 7686 TaxID=1367847 RepID=S5YD06_PARAH|nr:hypothetical protein [Paracoccus aminophilus]AGT09348.1 hypothetical protein JCM7686_2278 [Paracoccus aminophilus JCM 7686]
MSRRLSLLLLALAALLLLALGLGLGSGMLGRGREAAPGELTHHRWSGPVDFDDSELDAPPSFDVLPLSTAARLVESRFSGKLIAARLIPPTPAEFEQGVELVHELRLLTPKRDVLFIRLDAKTGRFLEVAGAGLTKARKRKGD